MGTATFKGCTVTSYLLVSVSLWPASIDCADLLLDDILETRVYAGKGAVESSIGTLGCPNGIF
jgi:hypothetical protein